MRRPASRTAGTALVALAMLLAAAGPAAAAPAISVAGAVIPPGTTTTVSGTGFAPNGLVDIFLDGDLVDHVSADASGAFPSDRVRIPADTAPGPHHIAAKNENAAGGQSKTITVGTQWAQFGFGAAGRAFNPYERLIGPGNVGDLEHAWSSPPNIGFDVHGAPVVYAGMLFYVIGDDLRAVRLSDRSLRWHKSSGFRFNDGAGPAAASGTIFIGSSSPGSGQAHLYAFNFSTGAQVWHADFPSTTDPIFSASPPVVSNGVVYVQLESTLGVGGGLFALPVSCSNPCTPLWHSTSQVGGRAPPAVGDGRVYVRDFNNRLQAYPVGCGTGNAACNPEWESDFEIAGSHPGPTYSNGLVLVNESDGTVFAFKSDGCGSSSCPSAWNTIAASSFFTDSNLAVAGGQVYEVGGDGFLYVFSTSCESPCDPILSLKVGNPVGTPGSVMIANGVAYARMAGDVVAVGVRCHNTFEGCTPLWRASVAEDDGARSYLTLSDGVLYVPSNRLKAFDLPSAGSR